MTPWLIALAALGGGVGAVARFLIDDSVTHAVGTRWPWGIFVVNASGSLLLGLATGLADSSLLSMPWLVILGGGVLGGYTTFSTAMVDTVRLIIDRRFGGALANALGMLAVTVVLALVGLLIGRSL